MKIALPRRCETGPHEIPDSLSPADEIVAITPAQLVLAAGEFIRRFLLHTLPDGFHRIRHYGFLANGQRTAKLALCRRLLAARSIADPATADPPEKTDPKAAVTAFDRCPCCGGAMVTVAVLPRSSPGRPPVQDSS